MIEEEMLELRDSYQRCADEEGMVLTSFDTFPENGNIRVPWSVALRIEIDRIECERSKGKGKSR
jgi:hypothetical protein